jgi:hypothetical protein
VNQPAQDDRPPRGALIVIAVGLLACVVAALLSTDKASGEAATLEWVKVAPVADSRPVPIPGGAQAMRLTDGEIRATGTNDSGYSLFRVSAALRVGAGAPIGGGRILCSVKGLQRAEIAQTSGGLRATYPRSSEDGIYSQEAPETILVDFSSHGVELAVLETVDLPRQFTTERGVKLEWPEYQVGTEHLKYFLAGGRLKQELVLPFYTVWKTTATPAAKVACVLTTSAGEATVATAGALRALPPPINEEEEEENQEARAEEEEEEAEETE